MYERIIAASLLAADFARLGDEVERAERGGADWLHLDIMDGNFVPNLSFGPALVDSIWTRTRLPFDVQLMVRRPADFVTAFTKVGAERITVHLESEHAGGDLRNTLNQIRASGCKMGLAINPATPLGDADPFLGLIDLLLIMTVNPGFGGQSFLPATAEKIESAFVRRAAHGHRYRIQIDGGINRETAALGLQMGADVLVSGTHLFGSPDMATAVRDLRLLPGRETYLQA